MRKKCQICKSNLKYNLCSNMKCKSWNKYRQQGSSWKLIEQGLTSDDPIPILCPKHNTIETHWDHTHGIFCSIEKKWITYKYIINRWYEYTITFTDKEKIAIRYNGNNKMGWWDWANQKTTSGI